MVGKMTIAGLRDRLAHTISHESSQSSHPDEHSGSKSETALDSLRRHIPFIASPLDPKTTEWLQNKHKMNNLTLKRRPTVAQQEANRVSNGMFRKQDAASPLELFFDLFFVANLAVFGFNFSQATPSTLGNYIGFFSLMWAFWFNVAIHDVRFYVDSILNRFIKLAQFVIFTSFTGLGPIYNSLESGETTRAFHGLALVFMTSRFLFLLQYGVVLWFVRPFKKTLVPLALMMLIYLCSAFAFLGTFLDGKGHELTSEEGVHRVNIWYIIIGIEAILVIVVSSIWRVLSFKKTHLVERVGLLTLIIMGEGIIGVIRSVASILDGSKVEVWAATGRVIAGVFLIYLIFVLYFTPIAHDRFGTIRQQIWALMHYPLHVAILLTEEGSAESMLWTTVIGSRGILQNGMPNLLDPSHGYATVSALVEKVNNTMTLTAEGYDHLSLYSVYNWFPDLDRISNLTEEYEYASHEFNEHAGEIIGEMINETTNYFFENFQFEGPEYIGEITNASEKLAAYYESYRVIYTALYICGGVLLLTLAFMYWIGKNNKTWEEWVAIGARAVPGLALPFVTIAAYTQPLETGFIFVEAGWLVSIIVFCYLFVVIVDNVFQGIADRRHARKVSLGQIEAGEAEDYHKRRYNGAYGPHVVPSPHASSANVPKLNEKGDPNRSKAIRFQERSQSSISPPLGTALGPSESDSLVSGEGTLNDRRESEQHLTPAAAAMPSNSIARKNVPHPQSQSYSHSPSPNSNDWQTEPTYYVPPTGRSNSNGYGRLDTSYRGNQLDAHDEEESRGFRNDRSFEEERMMISPVATRDDDVIERPQVGHHIPEQERER